MEMFCILWFGERRCLHWNNSSQCRNCWSAKTKHDPAQDGGRAARAALPPVSQSVEELKSIVASARYAPVPPPQPQHLSAAERCALQLYG